MRYLLDTNACIRVMQGHPAVLAKVGECAPDDFGVSMVSVFELLSGVQRCRDPEGEGKKVQRFLEPLHLLPFDFDSAERAAIIRWELEKAGTKIGPYDLQIAAQALALEVTLVSHNVREFSRVKGLLLEDWEEPTI
jgi:tRNA(fMet)-specific endonuclease VapC